MSSIRILAAEFAARSDDELRSLLQARPDLCLPPVPDFSALAARACTRVSVQRALEGLNRAELSVLEAVLVAGEALDAEHDGGLSAADVKGWVAGSTARILEPILRQLHALALLYRAPRSPGAAARNVRSYAPVAAVADVLGPYHAGLGRRYAQLGAEPADGFGVLAGPEAWQALLAQAPDQTAKLLERFRSSPVGAVPDAQRKAAPDGAGLDTAATPLDWLLTHRLLVPIDAGHVELPREAGIAARGFVVINDFQPEPVAEPPATTRIPLRDNAAYGAVAETLRLSTELLMLVERTPVATLRAGGVGVRELKRLGELLRIDGDTVSWLLELAALSGLLVLDVDTSQWTVSGTAPHWQQLERAGQWLVLVRSWLDAGRAPSLVGGALASGGTINTLAAEGNRPDAPAVRRRLLAALADIAAAWAEGAFDAAGGPGSPAGDNLAPVVTEKQLIGRLSWERPRLRRRFTRLVPGMLAEAARLGLLGSGALTEAGKLVAEADFDAAGRLMSEKLPAPLGHFLLQADLTAVAPGYLEPAVASRLALLSAREGQGPATIYRFSAATIRHALDAGQTAESMLEFLAGYSATEVPQPLSYLIQDTAARHGVLRAGSMGSYLRSDDEALLAELLADPQTALLGLVRLAPTVLASSAGARELTGILRELGYAPRLEGVDPGNTSAGDTLKTKGAGGGTPRTGTPDLPVRAEEIFPVRVNQWVLGAEELEQQVLRLRGAAQPGSPDSQSGPLIGLETLRRAIKLKAKVKMGFVNQRGDQRVDVVVPLSVSGGRVRVFDPDQETERVVSIHRVMDVEILEGAPHD